MILEHECLFISQMSIFK